MKTLKDKPSTEEEKPDSKVPALNKILEEDFLRFIGQHPAIRFKRNLRKMLLEFLMTDDGVEALHFKDLIYDLEGLFELLDSIEENME